MNKPITAGLLTVAAMSAAACGTASGTPAAATRPPVSPSPVKTPAVLPWGAPAAVQGGNGAPLKVTPVSAWWLTSGGTGSDGKPPLGRFLVIEMKLTPVSGPATFPAPMTGDGPEIISGGRVISDAGDDASSNVVWNTCLPGVDSNQAMQPGDTLLDGDTYDVPSQSGKLRWVSANGIEVSWKLPTADTGALPANVRQAISSGNGC